MNINYFWYSGNDLKSGKVISGMGGRFEPEWVAGLGRNLQVLASYPIEVYLMKSLRAKKPCTNIHEFFRVL